MVQIVLLRVKKVGQKQFVWKQYYSSSVKLWCIVLGPQKIGMIVNHVKSFWKKTNLEVKSILALKQKADILSVALDSRRAAEWRLL